MDNRRSESLAAAARAAIAAGPQRWIECILCKLWRRVPFELPDSAIPVNLTCENNIWDPAHASCSVPQQLPDDEIDAILDAQDEAMEGYETAPGGDEEEEEEDDDDDDDAYDLSPEEEELRTAADEADVAAKAAERAAAEAAAAASGPSAAASAPAAAAAVAAAADAAAEEEEVAGWLRTENPALVSLRKEVVGLHELHDEEIVELQKQNATTTAQLKQLEQQLAMVGQLLQQQFAMIQQQQQLLQQQLQQYLYRERERQPPGGGGGRGHGSGEQRDLFEGWR